MLGIYYCASLARVCQNKTLRPSADDGDFVHNAIKSTKEKV